MKNIGLILLVGGLLVLGAGFLLNSASKGGKSSAQAAATPTPIESLLTSGTGEVAIPPPAAPVETVATPAGLTTAVPTEHPPLTPFVPTATPEPATAVPARAAATPTTASGGTSNPAPTGPSAVATLPPQLIPLAPLEQNVYDGQNTERINSGVAPLYLDPTLELVARLRAQDMAMLGYFDHTSPSGDTAFTILGQLGYAYGVAGENLARNNYPDSQAASATLTSLLNSPEQRANVVSPSYSSVGVGVAVASDGQKYFVVVFAGN